MVAGPTPYRTNEASFTIEAQFTDESVNVFTGQAPDFENTSLVITRVRPDSPDVQAYADEQMAIFRGTFPDYHLLKSANTQAGGVECREHAFKWRSQRGTLYQWQLYMPIGGIIVVATFSALNQVTDRHRATIQAFVQSLKLE